MNASAFLKDWLKRPVILVAALLLGCSALAARDPFSPPENMFCDPLLPMPPPQLRGIIGRPANYRAWLVTRSGSGKLWAAQSWPDAYWQLRDVTALGITLAAATPCSAPLRINLQGSLYETHSPVESSSPAAAMAGNAIAGQPGAAFSGVR
jgi:pilus assembly protein HofP